MKVKEFVDTGSYILNGLVFQAVYLVVYLGIRLLPLLGSLATGKTFFSLAVVKNFLGFSNPDGYCLYFDTEAAVNKSLLAESADVDLLTVLVVVNVVTVEEFP